MKYIIKNCPAKYYIATSEMKCSEHCGNCKDITNCLLKRIVEISKMGMSDADFRFLIKTINNPNWGMVGNPVSYGIFKLLDIEECE